jgi:four helix bundle protein
MSKASYRDLKVWQMGMDLTVFVYRLTESFPRHEQFGLAQQLRRSAVSIPSNIAEGHGRRAGRQRYNFLEIAMGSLFELETQLELSRRLELIGIDDSVTADELMRNLGRGLSALMQYVAREAATNKPSTE